MAKSDAGIKLKDHEIDMSIFLEKDGPNTQDLKTSRDLKQMKQHFRCDLFSMLPTPGFSAPRTKALHTEYLLGAVC